MKHILFPLLFLSFVTSACGRASGFTEISGETMGTVFHIRVARHLLEHEEKHIREKIEGFLGDFDRQMNHYRPDSEISRLNRAKSGETIEIGPDFYTTLIKATRLSLATDKTFDPSLGALINLWGFGNEGGPREDLPGASEIEAALADRGAGAIRLMGGKHAYKERGRVLLNLSGIAKGALADRIGHYLEHALFKNYLVEVGGDVIARGRNENGLPWRIGIARPEPGSFTSGEYQKVIALDGAALATSGDYQNFFEAGGKHYSHILNPETGYPVSGPLASVSVIAQTAVTADAFATALFVMGPERGLAKVESEPGLEAMFVLRQKDGTLKEIFSSGFADYIVDDPA